MYGRSKRAGPEQRLRIDPAACDGIGICAHLTPELVELDRWGFPVVAEGALTEPEVAAAGRAVRGCPRQALWLADVGARALNGSTARRLNRPTGSTG